MVACGVGLADGVTGLLWCLLDDDAWLFVEVEPLVLPLLVPAEPVEVSWLPLPPWLAWALLVWVVRPRPSAAPRAPTMLSPARPACTRRLRLRCVMPSTMGRTPVRIL